MTSLPVPVLDRPQPGTRDRRPRGVLAALALAAVAVLALASPAAAHTSLAGSDPAAGAQLSAPPGQIRLTFTGAVHAELARVALSVDGGAPHDLRASVRGAEVIVEPPAEVVAGVRSPSRWRLDYRVVSDDGHPVTGGLDFTVRPTTAGAVAGGGPTATPTSSPSPAVDATPSAAPAESLARPTAAVDQPAADGFRAPAWLWAAGAVLILVGGVAVVAASARRRRSTG